MPCLGASRTAPAAPTDGDVHSRNRPENVAERVSPEPSERSSIQNPNNFRSMRILPLLPLPRSGAATNER